MSQAGVIDTGLSPRGQLTVNADGGTFAVAVGDEINIFGAGGATVVGDGVSTLTVTAGGGGSGLSSITPNSGTNPVVPTVGGNVTIQGAGSITTVGGLNSLTPQLTGLTNHSVLVGAGTDTITKVAPSATTGVPLISQGAAVDPTFGTASIGGGGTNATSFTQSNGVVVYNGTRLVNYAGPQISTAGRATNTTQPAFHAYSSVQQNAVTGDGTQYQVLLNSIFFNVGTVWNTTTGTFTAPVLGKYLFSWSIEITGIVAANLSGYINITAGGRDFVMSQGNFFAMSDTSIGRLDLNGSIIIQLAQTETMVLKVAVNNNGAKNINITSNGGVDPRTWLSGVLLC